MIEPFVIRNRLFRALNVPAALVPLCHVWATIENRRFGHELMAGMLCLDGSENAHRLAVSRRLKSLAAFLKSSPHEIGQIEKGGGKKKTVTFYGPFNPNRCVAWIQEQVTVDPDNSNPLVTIDRYVDESIRRFIPQRPKHVTTKKKKRGSSNRGRVRRSSRPSLTFEQLLRTPNSTFESALILAREGFSVFPVWNCVNGVCRCKFGGDCADPGKHPILTGWRTTAEKYGRNESSLVNMWARNPFANIGIATGLRWINDEILTVLDVDLRSFGHGSLANLERAELCPLPATLEHDRGGGPHKFFTYPNGFRSSVSVIGRGLDVQSYGKFVVGAGSTHQSGDLYSTNGLSIVRMPDDWAKYIEAAVSKTLAPIPEGERRKFLLRCAGGLVASGLFGELALAVLKDRRDKRCERGSHWFSDDDLKKMITYCAEKEERKVERAAA